MDLGAYKDTHLHTHSIQQQSINTTACTQHKNIRHCGLWAHTTDFGQESAV